MKEKVKNNEELDLKTQVYEVGYLLVPTLGEEEVPAVYSSLKDLIVSLKGELISDEMPKMMPLAYEMLKVIQNVRNRFNTAYFGWVKFEMDTESVLELKKKLDFDSNIIRFLLVKTVRENTLAPKKFVNKEGGSRKKTTSTKKEEEGVEMNEKEIDEEIDKMVSA